MSNAPDDSDPPPSTATRRFFYHANAMHCLCVPEGDNASAIVSQAAQAGMLHNLERGADRDENVHRISRIAYTFANYTVREFALERLLHPRYRPLVSLDVIEPLLAETNDFVRLMLWRGAYDWPALANLLVRHQVPFPSRNVTIPKREDLTVGGGYDEEARWSKARREIAKTRRALHTRNMFLGGRGPAEVDGRLYVTVDVWREVFHFLGA